MCLQCVVESKYVADEFILGFVLRVATNARGGKDWPKGHYGMVECNDPTFVFPPIPDPREKGGKTFAAMHGKLSQRFKFEPGEGYRIVKSAIRAGYRTRDGSLLWWLMLRVRKVTDGESCK